MIYVYLLGLGGIPKTGTPRGKINLLKQQQQQQKKKKKRSRPRLEESHMSMVHVAVLHDHLNPQRAVCCGDINGQRVDGSEQVLTIQSRKYDGFLRK